MWSDVLNNQKQDRVFRYFRGQLMNLGMDYYNNIQRENMSDRISRVASEEENTVNTAKQKYITQ